MYNIDMDNILCSNCNFQEINRKKHSKIIENTNLKSILRQILEFLLNF